MPERAPDALIADKAYDSDAIRDDLKQRGICAVILPKSNRTKMIRYNKRLYRQLQLGIKVKPSCRTQQCCPR